MLKVLESLENFFQEVFKRGLGQRPKVLGLGQSPKVLWFGAKPKVSHLKTFPQPVEKRVGKSEKRWKTLAGRRFSPCFERKREKKRRKEPVEK